MGMSSKSMMLKEGQRCIVKKEPIFPFSFISRSYVYNFIYENGQYILIICDNNEIKHYIHLKHNTTYCRTTTDGERAMSDANYKALRDAGNNIDFINVDGIEHIILTANGKLSIMWDTLNYKITMTLS